MCQAMDRNGVATRQEEDCIILPNMSWYIVFVCHQNDVCENYIDSVYVSGYGILSESGLCIFGKLYPIDFLVVWKCSSVLLQSVVMSYVDSGQVVR